MFTNMAQSHCRVCFQFLPAFRSRCPQCGDVNPRRVWSTVCRRRPRNPGDGGRVCRPLPDRADGRAAGLTAPDSTHWSRYVQASFFRRIGERIGCEFSRSRANKKSCPPTVRSRDSFSLAWLIDPRHPAVGQPILGQRLQRLERLQLDDVAGRLGLEHRLLLGERVDAGAGRDGRLANDLDLQQSGQS